MDTTEKNQENASTQPLSKYRSLTIVRTRHTTDTVVAKITNTAKGQMMTLSYDAIQKLASAMSSAIAARKVLPVNDGVTEEKHIKTLRLPVERIIMFVDSYSPNSTDSTSCSSPSFPLSQLYMGYDEKTQDMDKDSDQECEMQS